MSCPASRAFAKRDFIRPLVSTSHQQLLVTCDKNKLSGKRRVVSSGYVPLPTIPVLSPALSVGIYDMMCTRSEILPYRLRMNPLSLTEAYGRINAEIVIEPSSVPRPYLQIEPFLTSFVDALLRPLQILHTFHNTQHIFNVRILPTYVILIASPSLGQYLRYLI